MTAEQADASLQLRTLAAASRLRVRPDAEGWPVIPGRLGQIEWYCNGQDCHACPLPGEPALAVYTDRPRLFPKFWALPGVRRWQTGNREMRAVFPPGALHLVAGVIRARRRAARVMTPARLAGLAAAREKLRGACPRATSRRQDRAEAGTLDPDTSAGPEVSAMTEITPIGGVRRKEPLMLLERAVVEPGKDVTGTLSATTASSPHSAWRSPAPPRRAVPQRAPAHWL